MQASKSTIDSNATTARTAADPASAERILRLTMSLLDVQISMIWFTEHDHRQLALTQALSDLEVREIGKLCDRVVRDRRPLALSDISGNGHFTGISGALEKSGIRFVAVAPMFDETGQVAGALCAIDRQNHAFVAFESETLSRFAATAMLEIDEPRASKPSSVPTPKSPPVVIQGQYLEKLLEATATAVVTFDADRCITSWNAAAGKMFGYGAREIIGKPYDIILPADAEIQPQGTSVPPGTSAHRAHGGSLKPARHKNGEVFWVEEAFALAGGSAGEPAVGIILRDVTERKLAEDQLRRSEARLAAALRFSGLGTWDWNLATGHIRLSDHMCDANRLPHGSEWPVSAFLQLIHAGDRERWVELMARVKKGEAVPEFTLRAGRPTSETRYIRSIARLIQEPDGTPAHIVGFSQDITEQVQRDSDERQQEKLSALGHLAGGVAHELNNLLLPMIALTAQTLEDFTSLEPEALDREDTVENLKVIGDCGRQARDIVQKILLFARREAPSLGVADLPTALRDAAGFIQRLLPHSVTLSVRIAPDLSGLARFIRSELIEILTNLAVNATHAMDDCGTFTIALDKTLVDDKYTLGLTPGEYFVISASDTGCGMDEATQARIFEPFFTTKGVGRGTGLGLSAVHGIIRAWQGTIAVYSMPGEGTTFRLYIPLADPDAV